jgi:hypothetical protein
MGTMAQLPRRYKRGGGETSGEMKGKGGEKLWFS